MSVLDVKSHELLCLAEFGIFWDFRSYLEVVTFGIPALWLRISWYENLSMMSFENETNLPVTIPHGYPSQLRHGVSVDLQKRAMVWD